MGIFLYQIGIFIAIQIAAAFGKSSRNVAIVLISIFTILQVYTSGLMILQFLTIIVSYYFSKSIVESDKNKNQNNKPKQTNYAAKTEFDMSNLSDYGLKTTNPILLNSIPSSYAFLNKLCTIKEGIEYERRGCLSASGFNKPIDRYTFTISGNFLADIYVYPYHSKNVEKIPFPFLHLM